MDTNKLLHSKILVTGSDGFVGSHLCRELLFRGACVLAARRVRSDIRAETGSEILKKRINVEQKPHLQNIVIGDIGPNSDCTQVLVGVNAVVHLAARVHMMHDTASDPLAEFRKVNVEGTRRVAESAAKAGVRRFLFLSSVKVVGEVTEDGMSPLTEADLPQPKDAYGVSKWEAEQTLREIEQRTDLEVVIIRPPLIYGPAVKGNFLSLIRLVERGIPLPFASIRNQRSLLGLTNLADLICCCLVHPAAAGETFHASDGDDVSTPELVRRISQALGRSSRLLAIPLWMTKLSGTVTGKSEQVKRLCSSLQIDSSKVRQVLDWTPPCTMAEELARVAAWRATCFG